MGTTLAATNGPVPRFAKLFPPGKQVIWMFLCNSFLKALCLKGIFQFSKSESLWLIRFILLVEKWCYMLYALYAKSVTDSLFSLSFSHCVILPLISSFFRIFACGFCELALGKFQCTLSEFVRKSNRMFKSLNNLGECIKKTRSLIAKCPKCRYHKIPS